jgi:hypothetical protein
MRVGPQQMPQSFSISRPILRSFVPSSILLRGSQSSLGRAQNVDSKLCGESYQLESWTRQLGWELHRPDCDDPFVGLKRVQCPKKQGIQKPDESTAGNSLEGQPQAHLPRLRLASASLSGGEDLEANREQPASERFWNCHDCRVCLLGPHLIWGSAKPVRMLIGARRIWDSTVEDKPDMEEVAASSVAVDVVAVCGLETGHIPRRMGGCSPTKQSRNC